MRCADEWAHIFLFVFANTFCLRSTKKKIANYSKKVCELLSIVQADTN